MTSILNKFKTVLEHILILTFILFEEIIWDYLVVPINNALIKLDFMGQLKVKIMAQSAHTTLVIFIIPLTILELLGFQAGILIIAGYFTWGVVLYALKVLMAGVTFWIFRFSKDKLLTIEWFATAYGLVMKGFNWVKDTDIYISTIIRMKKIKADIKEKLSKYKSGSSFSEGISKKYYKIKAMFKDNDINDTKNTPNEPKTEVQEEVKEEVKEEVITEELDTTNLADKMHEDIVPTKPNKD